MTRVGTGDELVRHRAAIVGTPVAHSLSPVLHRAGYAAAGLTDWAYERIECGADRFADLVAGADPSFAGFSVTMPNKAVAAGLADERSARVDRLAVANTLHRDGSRWRAENTDVDGVAGALRAAGVGTRLAVERALLLGGGNTARSAVAALAELGCVGLVVAGRRPSSTRACAALAQDLGLAVRETGLGADEVAAAAAEADVVISTVPDAAAVGFLAPALASAPVFLDALYHPWPTPLAAGRDPGAVTVTGLDMLLHQSFRQFELITGDPAPRAAMRDALRGASGTDLPLPL